MKKRRHIYVENVRGVKVLTLDLDSLDEFAEPLLKAEVDPVNDRKVLLNLSRVGFANSTGLRMLIDVQKSLEAEGGVMKICEFSTLMKQLFEVTRLDDFFDLHETEEMAFSSFEDNTGDPTKQ